MPLPRMALSCPKLEMDINRPNALPVVWASDWTTYKKQKEFK